MHHEVERIFCNSGCFLGYCQPAVRSGQGTQHSNEQVNMCAILVTTKYLQI
jgi:hypothetical protein